MTRTYQLEAHGCTTPGVGVTVGVIYQDGEVVRRTREYHWHADDTASFFHAQDSCEKEAARLAGIRRRRK